jgi:hypothetical protein
MTRYGWHYVKADRRLGYQDARQVRVGLRLGFLYFGKKPDPNMKPRLCCRGMHASPTAAGAWELWKDLNVVHGGDTAGAWLCRVRIDGTSYSGKQCSRPDDTNKKFCGTHRTVVGMIRREDIWDAADEPYIRAQMQRRNDHNRTRVEVK